MNTLHNGSDGKSLAFGGLTHRRPPSPDLYKTRKGQRSTDSSEAGSAHGSEYSGLYQSLTIVGHSGVECLSLIHIVL